jgi:hypothetical protein
MERINKCVIMVKFSLSCELNQRDAVSRLAEFGLSTALKRERGLPVVRSLRFFRRPCPPIYASFFRLSCSRTWGATGCQRTTTTIRLMSRLRLRRRRLRRRRRVAPPRRSRPSGPRCFQATRPCSPPFAIMNVLRLRTMAFAKTVVMVRLSLIATCAPLRLRPNSTPVCADQCGPNPRPS